MFSSTGLGRITNLIKNTEDAPYLLHSFLKVKNECFYFVGPYSENYKIEKLEFLPKQTHLFIIRDKRTAEIFGYRIIPRNMKTAIISKNYLLLNVGKEKNMYNDYTGFPGIQCYFNANSLVFISNRVTDYYQSIESIL